MNPLPDQELFEAMLLKSTDERLPVVPKKIVVWFSASWCGPCRRVDGKELVQSFPEFVATERGAGGFGHTGKN